MKIRTYKHPRLVDKIFGIICDEDANRWFVILQILTDDERILSVIKEVENLDTKDLIEEPIGYSNEKLESAITRWDLMMTDPVIQASMVVQEIKNPVVGIDSVDAPDDDDDDGIFEDDILGA